MHTRRRLLALAVAAGLAVAPAAASAFSLSNHILITEAASRQIRACVEKHPGRWEALRTLAAHEGSLIACNLRQDDPDRKLVLWHFYGNGRKLEGSFVKGDFLSVDNSLDAFFERLVAGLPALRAEPETLYAHVGAILHYVQDVAVPAHAIPIFHPSPVWNGDNFDSFPFQATAVADDLATCERLLGVAEDSFPGLLRETAARTLAAIAREIPPGALTVADGAGQGMPRTWNLFWNASRGKNGFGEYGCVRDKFGVTALECEKTKLSVSAKATEDFAHELQRSAVEATVRALLVAHRLAPASPGAGVPVTCPVAGVDKGALVVCAKALHGPPLARECPGEDDDPRRGGCGLASGRGTTASFLIWVGTAMLVVLVERIRRRRARAARRE